jgi:glycogen operon protein
MRFNPAKLLIDPYALAIEGAVDWSGPVFGHDRFDRNDPAGRDHGDSAPFVPRSVVVDTSFDWGDDQRPETPWNRTLIYETHVRGLTMTHPDVPPELRGTYAGMATEPVISHLTALGVTAVELMPVHHYESEGFLIEQGLTNYWGYSTLGFFAPHAPYAASGQRGGQVTEFKQLVRALHRAGIEVLLDVVYNHTGEGTAIGPTLSFRGIDNLSYYRLDRFRPGDYLDFTGTGNSLNVAHPASLELVMDSLRYWVTEMHVDGFRFDLAPTLAREYFSVDRQSAFFDLIHQDPVVNVVKLIAEPWDVGPGGYQLGNFPALWSEWNGRYRDDVRNFWRGADWSLGDFASRFAGSSDLYGSERRRPRSSINFVTAHDGYTLADLVAYEQKHNEANG